MAGISSDEEDEPARSCLSANTSLSNPDCHPEVLVYVDDTMLYRTGKVPALICPAIEEDLLIEAKWAEIWGMCLNASKTVAMFISRTTTTPPRITLAAGQYSHEHRHQGFILDSALSLHVHVNALTRKGATVFLLRRLSYKVRNRDLLLKIYKTRYPKDQNNRNNLSTSPLPNHLKQQPREYETVAGSQNKAKTTCSTLTMSVVTVKTQVDPTAIDQFNKSRQPRGAKEAVWKANKRCLVEIITVDLKRLRERGEQPKCQLPSLSAITRIAINMQYSSSELKQMLQIGVNASKRQPSELWSVLKNLSRYGFRNNH
ncbi:hypothetical protein CAPTEDRAFT_185083 [Capitella teleta]|uniref:Reverse transcriptase domain-containing protein n=1 Tax=Capitella teleta TaxID=283909 RepID=R7U4Z0_CAPTE|nr:hypothetical protein CAPTEDRAFT_185083 [Capitella teleta]|eukprot:ELT98225.1 hypothetical protein CAPTEDRAFT_185083 [Capitella teleta]